MPFREFLSFLGKVVPLEGDTTAGNAAVTIPVILDNGTWNAGPLICNEDAYAFLARDMVKLGADWLFVVTNDAWYGEGSAAYKHAANSVLRAVETRRPVIRCGNHGWSGWIDELGRVRQTAIGDNDSIYFRGSTQLNVHYQKQYQHVQSFYVRHGDWFVAFCGLLAVLGFLGFVKRVGDEDTFRSGTI